MAFADAVYRMNLSCYYATSDEDARISYIARSHSIVIIDTRNRKILDGISLCRSFDLSCCFRILVLVLVLVG